MPAGGRALRGLRLLHTHLNGEGLSQEDLMDLLFLRLDAAMALTVSEAGEPEKWQGGWLAPASGEGGSPYVLGPMRVWHDNAMDFGAIASEMELQAGRPHKVEKRSGQAAILISVSTESRFSQEKNLDELADLAATAGVAVAGRMIQRVSAPNPRLILGKGKLEELEVLALNARADMLIFDGELSPAQLHNLAEATERKVLDRTQLILDIFSRHAATKGGKLQVELAQLAYSLPRLAGRGKAFDRLMGGVGGRGPGESRLETDRRKARERMAFLKRELGSLRERRNVARKKREKAGLPVAALVGYTNAGKSTLLNTLTRSSILAENKLFATLDPTTRRLRFPKEREITLADTVGFIRNLPSELREAFGATLEELSGADLLVHVADASHPELERQMEAVESVLDDLGLLDMPRLLVLNKCDLLQPGALENLLAARPGAIPVSAVAKTGLDRLMRRLEGAIFMESSLGRLSAARREEN